MVDRTPRIHYKYNGKVMCWPGARRFADAERTSDWSKVTCKRCHDKRQDEPYDPALGYRLIRLSGGQLAKVDPEDYDRLKYLGWSLNEKGGHAKRCERRGKSTHTVLMHREIVNAPKGMLVDHINWDPLDNRKANLRVCSQRENLCNRGPTKQNTTGFKGVSKVRNRYQVSIDCKVIGWFDDPIEAAKCYDKAAKELHGEFAFQNLPAIEE